MTQINPSAKQRQTHGHGEQSCGCQQGTDCGRKGLGGWGQQMQTVTYRMNKKQGPTIEDRELYLLFNDKP